MGKLGNKRKGKAAREIALAETEKLIRLGYPMRRIAEKLGVSFQQVFYDSQIIRKRAKETATKDREEWIRSKLEAHEELRAECLDAWERSKLDAGKTVEERIPLAEPEEGNGKRKKRRLSLEDSLVKIKEIITREGRLPDSAYLNTILATHKADRELLGLDAPTKVGMTVINVPWSEIEKEIEGSIEDVIEGKIAKAIENVSDNGRNGAAGKEAGPPS